MCRQFVLVLKKPRLQEELLLGQDERVSVAEMRSMLSEWIMENPPASPKSNGLISLLDDLSPLALCSNEHRTILFVSQRNSPTILKVAVSCTGTVLKAESESFITISQKACCTGLAYNKQVLRLPGFHHELSWVVWVYSFPF